MYSCITTIDVKKITATFGKNNLGKVIKNEFLIYREKVSTLLEIIITTPLFQISRYRPWNPKQTYISEDR